MEEEIPKTKALQPKRYFDTDGRTHEEPPRATQAFNDYFALGQGRTLEKLAKQYSQPENSDWTNNEQSVFRMLAEYSRKYNWQERVRAELTGISAKALSVAQQKAASHADERIRLSQLAQRTAEVILLKAKVEDEDFSPKDARALLKTAVAMLQLGLTSERAEIGEGLASIKPAKPPSEMTDEELEAHVKALRERMA